MAPVDPPHRPTPSLVILLSGMVHARGETESETGRGNRTNWGFFLFLILFNQYFNTNKKVFA